MSSGLTERSLALPVVLRRRARNATASTPLTITVGAGDEELMAQVQAGHHEAVGVLFDRYSRLVLAIGLRALRDSGEAEDLVQEVFLELYEKAKSFDESKGSARTWLVQMAYRRALDRRAYLGRRCFYNGTELKRLKNTLQEGSDLEEQVAARVTGERLRAAFEELSERQRTTLEMFFFEGCNLREISERRGESLENTRHSYYRGLENLRRTATALALRSGKPLL